MVLNYWLQNTSAFSIDLYILSLVGGNLVDYHFYLDLILPILFIYKIDCRCDKVQVKSNNCSNHNDIWNWIYYSAMCAHSMCPSSSIIKL